jgi:hypothetical protein
VRGQSSAKSNLLVHHGYCIHKYATEIKSVACGVGSIGFFFKRLCQDVAGQCFYDNFCMLLIQNKMTTQQIKVAPVA